MSLWIPITPLKIRNLDLPDGYALNLPRPIPPATMLPIRTIDTIQEWPITPLELSRNPNLYCITEDPDIPKVTLDYAANMIPYFPGVSTGNMYCFNLSMVSNSKFPIEVCGCTGSYLHGVTGSAIIIPYYDATKYTVSVYIRWDNVSGSTGSYTII